MKSACVLPKVLKCSRQIGNQLVGKIQKAEVCVVCSRVRPAAGLTVLERMVGGGCVLDSLLLVLPAAATSFVASGAWYYLLLNMVCLFHSYSWMDLFFGDFFFSSLLSGWLGRIAVEYTCTCVRWMK